MATTYTLINSNVLSSSALNVTFTSIPSTYTDLVLRFSARSDATDLSLFTVNNDTLGSAWGWTRLRGTGSAASSTAGSGSSSFRFNNSITYDGAFTSNTFTSGEVYVPSYTTTQAKPMSAFIAQEDNATYSSMAAFAGLYTTTTPITEVRIANGGSNFVAGSSFYLYGISNA